MKTHSLIRYLVFLFIVAPLFSSCESGSAYTTNTPSYTIVKSRFYYADQDSILRALYDFIREFDADIVREEKFHLDFVRTISDESLFFPKDIEYRVLVFRKGQSTKVTLNLFKADKSLGRTVLPQNDLANLLSKEFWGYLDKRFSN